MSACGGCSATWGGTNTAHCGGCHITTTGVTAFDRHRNQRGERGQCQAPEAVGLVDAGRAYPCYGLPGDRPVPDAA